jgi:hypothetical protein
MKQKTLPTELLIQHSLETRGSVRLKVSVGIWDTHSQDPGYQMIQDSVVYLEVNNPGLVWRVVGNVVQGMKRLDAEMENEHERTEGWLNTENERTTGRFTILSGSGVGRPKGSTAENIRRSKADSARQELDEPDEGTPVGPV